MSSPPADDDRLERARSGATRWFGPIGGLTPALHLSTLPDEIDGDVYGEGGVVALLEQEVAEAVGHEAALLLPTGTMAQGIALRIHAEDAGCPVVAMHPTSHPLLHEDEALPRVHGLHVRPVGDARKPLTADDLASVSEPLAAVLLELPQRELGGRLPVWDDLLAMVQTARDRGAAVHLDGARLWECEPAYGRDAAEIAGLFDTVYVSLYKGLGAIGGACLAGPAEVVARAAEWRHRLGGQVIGLWPYAASAMAGLRARREDMAARLDHLRACAAELAPLDDVVVAPDPPEAALCRLLLRVDPGRLREAALAVAEQDRVWTWAQGVTTDHPGWLAVELHASANLQAFTPSEVGDLVARLVAPAPAQTAAAGSPPSASGT